MGSLDDSRRTVASMSVTLCVWLWAHDGRAAELGSYEDRVLQLLPDHGAHLVHRVRGQGGTSDPLEVHLIDFPSEAALDAYLNDHRRVVLQSERDAAVARTELFRVIREELPPPAA